VQASHGCRVVGLDTSGEESDMNKFGQPHQGMDQASAVTSAPQSRIGHVRNATRWYIDDAEHSLASWSALPRCPPVSSAAVDVTNWLVTIPRYVLVPAGLLSTPELTKRSVGQIENQLRPIRTSKPSLRFGILEPRSHYLELIDTEGVQRDRHRTMVASAVVPR
jgi:hypothetical protein